MKKFYAALLAASLIFCTGCDNSDHITSYVWESIVPNNPAELFASTLERDENGQFIYPDSYGGFYYDNGIYVVLTTSSDFSEYRYIKDAYSNVEFKQVEYSLNFLQRLADSYLRTSDRETETVYSAGVDEKLNRAVIFVDEQTLLNKPTDPSKSPIIFELGSQAAAL